MKLLELAIDQYQRYRMAADIINALRGDKRVMRILEVGGHPPKLDRFLPDDKVIIIDRIKDLSPSYLMADAFDLPFADDSFDVVISLDVLEHIQYDNRKIFVEESARVANSILITAAPFEDDDGLIRQGEKLLIDFIKEAHGYTHKYLSEHLRFGLPSIKEITRYHNQSGWETHILPNGYFLRWFSTILMDYLAEVNESLLKISHKLREYYNYYFYQADNCEPAYRHFVVAKNDGFSDNEMEALALLTEAPLEEDYPPMEYLATLTELARLDAQTKMEDRIKGLEHELAAREEEIDHLKQYAAELELFSAKVKKALPFRIYEKYLKK